MLHLIFFAYNNININNNETVFTEPRRVFKEYFEIKVQEVDVLKYLSFGVFQYPLGFIIDHTDYIMELMH